MNLKVLLVLCLLATAIVGNVACANGGDEIGGGWPTPNGDEIGGGWPTPNGDEIGGGWPTPNGDEIGGGWP
ncbi:MAG: hypothetical protein JSV85_05260, partial [Candidatus Bathyarchaeota archaeon]